MSDQLERILVIEDDPACRALLEAVFRFGGYAVTSIDSVIGAYAVIERVKPELIVLDIALPYRSGASWLAELRATPAFASLPVVILTAVPEVVPADRRILAQAIVRKPFKPESLLATVRAARGRAAEPALD